MRTSSLFWRLCVPAFLVLVAISLVPTANASSTIEIISPGVNDRVYGTDTVNIHWLPGPEVKQVDLFYSVNGTQSFQRFDGRINASNGSYAWYVQSFLADDITHIKVQAFTASRTLIGEDITPVNVNVPPVEDPVTQSQITLTSPTSTDALNALEPVTASWEASEDIQWVDVYFSRDAGATYQLLVNKVDADAGRYIWSAPSYLPGEEVGFRVIGIDASGNEAALDDIDGFVTVGGVLETDAAPAASLGVVSPGSLLKLACPPDSTVTHPCRTVYYYGFDGMRHAFPHEKVFFTWYDSYDGLRIVSQGTLHEIPLGANVTYRPGVHMVKFQSVDTVYAVRRHSQLHPIASEEIARELYGNTWNQNIHDIPDTFYANYSIGSDIESSYMYDPFYERVHTTLLTQQFGEIVF